MDLRRASVPLARIGAVALLGATAVMATSSWWDAPRPREAPADDGRSLAVPGLVQPRALGDLARDLDLSGEQRRSIEEFVDEAQRDFEALDLQLRADGELLARTEPGDSAYPTVVTTVSQSAGGIAAEFVRRASELRSQVHTVLTPAQRSALLAIELARDERRRDGGERALPEAP